MEAVEVDPNIAADACSDSSWDWADVLASDIDRLAGWANFLNLQGPMVRIQGRGLFTIPTLVSITEYLHR
jgi:hypothetical protein